MIDNIEAITTFLVGNITVPFMIRSIMVVILAILVKKLVFQKSFSRKLVGRVSEIRVHPVKSAAPQIVDSWDVSLLGLEHDRQFVLLNQYGTMMTLRRHPKFVLINTCVKKDCIEITGENMPLLRLPLYNEIKEDSKIKKVNVFQNTTDGIHVSEEADSWFSTYFNMEGLQLYGFPKDGVPRFVDDKGVKEENYAPDPLMFADGCPLLLLSEETVNEINNECSGTDVTVDRFRPNIVIKGCKPFDEDSWSLIQIGDNTKLQCLYPCQRCVAINVDPIKGTIDSSNTRLLKELERVRPTPDGEFPLMPPKIPIIGCNYGVRSVGRIKVGDPIYHIQ